MEPLALTSCSVDLTAGAVHRGAETIALTDREAALLRFLVAHRGEPVPRDTLLTEVWRYDARVLSRTVDATVRRLRKKIERDPTEPDHLKTVYGIGYRLDLGQSPATTTSPPPVAPRASLPFIGRERELSMVRSLASTPGLVTVVGPAGAGKTRLALEVLHAADHDAIFVPLVEATTRAELVRAVGAGLGLPLTHGRTLDDLVELVAHRLETSPALLLVLDNAEQAVEPLAALLSAWLTRSPSVTFLVTSQERLRVGGEQLLTLGSLTPDEACELFRARAVDAGSPAVHDPELLLEIVGRLDGLPLAIELAAARTRLLGLADIRARLDDRFALLSHSRRDASARHATLHTAISWSWALLDAPSQRTLCQAAAFRGSFDLAAAEAVIRPGGSVSVLDALQGLCEKSLLRVQSTGTGTRFILLENIRAFADAQLSESRDATYQRHRDHYLGWAEPIVALAWRPGAVERVALLAAEYDNLMAIYRRAGRATARRVALVLDAILRSMGPFDLHLEVLEACFGDPEPHPDAVWYRGRVALGHLLRNKGQVQRAREVLIAVLDSPDAASPLQTEAHCWLSLTLQNLGRPREADAVTADALEAATTLGDIRLVGLCLLVRAVLDLDQARFYPAIDTLRRAIAHLDQSGDEEYLTVGWSNLATGLIGIGQIEEAQAAIGEALEHEQRTPYGHQRAFLMVTAGHVALLRRDLEQAATSYVGAVARHRELGHRAGAARAVAYAAWARMEAGQWDTARQLFREALSEHRRIGDRRAEGTTLGEIGVLSQLEGRPEAAERQLREAVTVLESVANPRAAAYFRAHLVTLTADRGDLAQARQDLEAARGSAPPDTDSALDALCELSETYIDLRAGELEPTVARERSQRARKTVGATSPNVLMIASLLDRISAQPD